jgi:hypothetical protein
MIFEFTPIAEASVSTLMQSINRVIINPLILLLFAAALVYFLYGVFQYFLSPNKDELRTTSKSHMLYGLIGIFIMMSVFGIMRLILNTLGENRIKITDTGEVSISSSGFTNIGDTGPADSGVYNPPSKSVDPKNPNNLAGATNQKSFLGSPFESYYISDTNCWRDAFPLIGSNPDTLRANAQAEVRKRFQSATGENISTLPAYYPVITETSAPPFYDAASKNYYYWVASVHPKKDKTDKDGCRIYQNFTYTGGTTSPAGGGSASSKVEPKKDANGNPVYNISPFKSTYASDSVCWREAFVLSGPNELELRKNGLPEARKRYGSATGADLTKLPAFMPMIVETSEPAFYDEKEKKFYYWVAAVQPKPGASADCQLGSGGGSGGGTNPPADKKDDEQGDPDIGSTFTPHTMYSDSNLNASSPGVGPAIKALNDKWGTDTDTAYRVVSSGTSSNISSAKSEALRNGQKMIANKKQSRDLSSINYIILEEKLFESDGKFHYFTALAHAK